MAMNSLELEGGLKGMGWGSPQHLHAAIESMRLGFVDTLQYNADPEVRQLPRSSPGLIADTLQDNARLHLSSREVHLGRDCLLCRWCLCP